MAPIKTQNNNYISNYGEAVVRHATVLASCYIVDSAASLKGLHYCSTVANGLPSPPSSPPLAAITSSNELAILPKNRTSGQSASLGSRAIDVGGSTGRRHNRRRGGATLIIREECVRFFCETMRAVFLVERDMVVSGSGLMTGAISHNSNAGMSMLPSPPDDDMRIMDYAADATMAYTNDNDDNGRGNNGYSLGSVAVSGWLEIWDYAGGASFRGFVADGNDKALFVFFDLNVLGRDLKPSLMAMIELAESALGCTQIVICVDRQFEIGEAQALMKSLQWVGFELTALDLWVSQEDVLSEKWVFMGMEV